MDLFQLALKIKSEGLAEGRKALSALDAQGRSLVTRFAGVSKAYAGIAAAGALVAAGKFLKDSIEEAAAAEKVMGELRLAVENVGGNYSLLSKELDNTANKMAKFTRFSDDETRDALSRMILISGDTAGSIENIGLASDIAAKKQISLASAGEIVAKVMAGNTRGLKEFGINTKDSAEALEILRKQYKGFAEQDGKSLEGRLIQIKNAWGEVLEAFGKAITGQNNLPDAIGKITGKLIELASWIDSQAGKWQGWASNAFKWIEGVEQRLAKVERIAHAIYRLTHPGQEPKTIGRDVTSGSSSGSQPGRDFQDVSSGPLGGNSTPPPRGGTGTGKTGSGVKIPGSPFTELVESATDKALGNIDSLTQIPEAIETISGMTSEQLNAFFDNYDKSVDEGDQAAIDRLNEFNRELEEAAERIKTTITQGMAQTLGDAVYNAFAAAFNGEGLGGIFKAFGKTVLAGVGQIFTQLGMIYLEYGGIMQALSALLPNPFTAGFAGLAIGAALIAMGSALGAVATGTGRGTAQAGAFRERPGSTQDMVRLQFVNRPGYGNQLTPAPAIHFTVIGERDPKAQAAIGRIVKNNTRRQG